MLIFKDILAPMKICPGMHGKLNGPRTIVDGCSKLYSLWDHRSEYSSYDVFMFLKIVLKGKIHTFLKCIYYRAYIMVGIIIHFMCVKSLQLACN